MNKMNIFKLRWHITYYVELSQSVYYAGMEMAFKRQCTKVAYNVIYGTNETGMKIVPI